jgi:hypothetical protein
MVDTRAKSVGRYLMRLVGGVLVILGALAIFGTLSQGNLTGAAIGAVFIIVGALLFKRSGGFSGTENSATTR